MGLEIVVGGLARIAEEEPEDLEAFREPFDMLNEVLAMAGQAPHNEPVDLPEGQRFEAAMFGYWGLHKARRLAAYHALEGKLPRPGPIDDDATADPVMKRMYGFLDGSGTKPQGLLDRLLGKRPERLGFEHLIMHSDCEGFYVPRDFEHVIIDLTQPQRPGLGAMIGSTPRLLGECRMLAEFIGLPEGLHPEDELDWEPEEPQPPGAPLWRSYPIEAHSIATLIRGCEASMRTGAVLQFA